MTGQNIRPKMKSYSGSQVKSICSVTWLKNRVLPQTLIEGSGRGLQDVSTGNLMMNEDKDNPSQRAFLIDLDLAIRLQRDEPSGARGKTGTRAFMPIDLLLGEKQSFMHGLETFFWYIFWVCIHHNGPEESRVVPMFDKWNYVDMEELAKLKLDTVAQETIFLRTVTENFTPYYKPLIPWVNRLRKVVFGQTMGERRSIALFPVQSHSQEGKRRSTSDRGTLSFRLPLFPPPKTRGYRYYLIKCKHGCLEHLSPG